MDENKQPAKFEVSMDCDQLKEVLSTHKLILLCIFDCPCYDKIYRASEVYDLVNKENPIRAQSVVNFLTHINYDPKCSHRFLEGFKILSPCLYTPIFNCWRV
jgi:hypothetical protein